MNDAKKTSPMLMLAVGAGVLGLCCVGSCGLALVGRVGGAASAPVASGVGTGLEGAWSQGSTTSFTQYRNAATGTFAPPSGSGARFDFKPDGDCEHFALFQTTLYSCTQNIFIAHDDCEWELNGDQLTVRFGEGDTITRACGGEVKRSTADAATVKFTVTLTGDELVLAGDGTTLTLRRER